MQEAHFTWFSLIPGLPHGMDSIMGSLLVLIILVVLAILGGRRRRVLTAAGTDLVPESKVGTHSLLDLALEKLFGLAENVMGFDLAVKHFPVIGCMFVYIFLSNFLGLIPGMPASTGEMNTTLALGLAVFFYYNFVGFKEHGISYLKHFAGPVIWLAPLMIIIELMSHLFRPISLGIRLQGNISGDHAVLEAFTNISPWGLGIPVIFYGLGVFVAFIQAFVFCLMTMTYISLSASHDH